jgi:hypothetical protein
MKPRYLLALAALCDARTVTSAFAAGQPGRRHIYIRV